MELDLKTITLPGAGQQVTVADMGDGVTDLPVSALVDETGALVSPINPVDTDDKGSHRLLEQLRQLIQLLVEQQMHAPGMMNTPNAAMRALAVRDAGANCDNAVVTSVTSTTTSQLAIMGNARRRTLTFVNDSTSVCFIRYGTSAAKSTDYSYKIAAGQTWEMPLYAYNGPIQAIWTTANGALKVTEVF